MKIGLLVLPATDTISWAIFWASSPCSDALIIATQSMLGSSTITWSVRLMRLVSLKIAAVTSTGLSSEPKLGTNSRSFAAVSAESGGTCIPRPMHSSVIRMPAPPEMVMMASRLPAGSRPHRKPRP